MESLFDSHDLLLPLNPQNRFNIHFSSLLFVIGSYWFLETESRNARNRNGRYDWEDVSKIIFYNWFRFQNWLFLTAKVIMLGSNSYYPLLVFGNEKHIQRRFLNLLSKDFSESYFGFDLILEHFVAYLWLRFQTQYLFSAVVSKKIGKRRPDLF